MPKNPNPKSPPTTHPSQYTDNIEISLASEMPKTISHVGMSHRQLMEDGEGGEEREGREGREGGDDLGNLYEEVRRLKIQNRNLRGVNRELRKQLEDFGKRLDQSLKKKDRSEKKMKIGQEIVQSMELKNAYKMCDIYKKQISFLKRRESETRQGRIDQLQNLNFQLQRQKQSLLTQIKDLKKITKQQQKGLKQMAGPNAMKLLEQNQKLREQIRRLQMLNQSKQPQTQPQKNKQTVQQNKQDTEIDRLKSKIIKGNRKISLLMQENQKLKEYVEELRGQVIEKDKDCAQIRDRLTNLRKQFQESKKRRIETEPESFTKPVDSSKENNKDNSVSRHLRLKSQFQVEGDRIRRHKKNSASLLTQKYPKMIQKGQKSPSGTPWNDHQFSSKIKQIQVSPHPLGHIKQLHFRYQKGQSSRTLRNKYASFCCEENTGEYIKYVRGGFKSNLLRYLVVETNKGRKSNFCECQLEDQCTNFQFSCTDNEYLGSFFGENVSQGICRIGCFIEAKK